MAHQSSGRRDGSGGGNRASAGSARGPAPPTQQLQSMSVRDRFAVDGSPLKMDDKVAPPRPNPMASLQVHPKESKKVLDTVQASSMMDAEFPLREAFTNPNTTVYTNHFIIKIDDTKPLYEYNIIGLLKQASRRTLKKPVQGMIDGATPLVTNRNNFVTDFTSKLVSWTRFPGQLAIGVRSTEWQTPITIGLQYAGVVDTDLLRRYAEGKVEPTKVGLFLFDRKTHADRDP